MSLYAFDNIPKGIKYDVTPMHQHSMQLELMLSQGGNYEENAGDPAVDEAKMAGGTTVRRKRGRHLINAEDRFCRNCGTRETTLWRRSKLESQLLCNACGTYERLHDSPRPFGICQRSTHRTRRRARRGNSAKGLIDNNGNEPVISCQTSPHHMTQWVNPALPMKKYGMPTPSGTMQQQQRASVSMPITMAPGPWAPMTNSDSAAAAPNGLGYYCRNTNNEYAVGERGDGAMTAFDSLPPSQYPSAMYNNPYQESTQGKGSCILQPQQYRAFASGEKPASEPLKPAMNTATSAISLQNSNIGAATADNAYRQHQPTRTLSYPGNYDQPSYRKPDYYDENVAYNNNNNNRSMANANVNIQNASLVHTAMASTNGPATNMTKMGDGHWSGMGEAQAHDCKRGCNECKYTRGSDTPAQLQELKETQLQSFYPPSACASRSGYSNCPDVEVRSPPFARRSSDLSECGYPRYTYPSPSPSGSYTPFMSSKTSNNSINSINSVINNSNNTKVQWSGYNPEGFDYSEDSAQCRVQVAGESPPELHNYMDQRYTYGLEYTGQPGPVYNYASIPKADIAISS